MTQDGNGRSRHEWLVTVYDNINRPTQTRIFTTTATFVALIENAAANTVYPGSVGTLLTKTHYDDYSGLPSRLSATLSIYLSAVNIYDDKIG